VGDIQIARLDFLLLVGGHEQAVDDVASQELRIKHAFASYASEDRDEVLGRIQGMQKVVSDLNVFLDVASLRSGENWMERLQHEIVTRDVFYLFWSLPASRSPWVEREWRTALSTRGLEFIDPVPLAPPSKVPPPRELASLHFNEWTLAFLTRD
jgi:TIR domain